MRKTIAAAAGIGAAVLGGGTAALAATGTSTPSQPAPSTSSPAKAAHHNHHRGHRDQLQRALHSQWVTGNGKAKKFVTHDEIRGSVTAVSPTSVSVKAADGVTETYAVTSSTKVHARADGKGKSGTIGEVKVGDRVRVGGTGTTQLTATRVRDAGAAKAK